MQEMRTWSLHIVKSPNPVDVNTEDTIQTYLPDSTDEDTIMSVKDIVKKNDHKVVAVYVDVPEDNLKEADFL